MSEILSISEIQARFDGEWVLVVDPQLDADLDVLSGHVVWHSKDRDEVYQKAVELRPRRSASLYLGKMPAGTAVVP